ncbi:hypothetical protein [Pseudomonas umsongensis]|nr:hypothetical protein [Pseudomonas umsongensis]
MEEAYKVGATARNKQRLALDVGQSPLLPIGLDHVHLQQPMPAPPASSS